MLLEGVECELVHEWTFSPYYPTFHLSPYVPLKAMILRLCVRGPIAYCTSRKLSLLLSQDSVERVSKLRLVSELICLHS